MCGYVTICSGLPLPFENLVRIQLDVSQIGHICVPANWQTDCGFIVRGSVWRVSATGTYLTHANPGMQLLAVILVNAITQLLHVGSVRQLHHVGAHEPLQTSANARQIETVCVGGGSS